MKSHINYLCIIAGVFSLAEIGSGLKCHRCLAKSGDGSCEKGYSSLPIMECSQIETRCSNTQYDGYGLTCYSCYNLSGDKSCEKGYSTLPKVQCSPIEDGCSSTQYDLIQNGSVLNSAYLRGCATGKNSCEQTANIVGPLFTEILNYTGIEIVQSKCKFCDKDLCNGGVEGEKIDEKKEKRRKKLTCYRCLGTPNDENCESGNVSSLPTVECSPLENRCIMSAYEVMKDGEVVNVIYKRGCTCNNYCKSASELVERLYQLINITNGSIVQRSCEVCRGNLCNGEVALGKKGQEPYEKNSNTDLTMTSVLFALTNILV